MLLLYIIIPSRLFIQHPHCFRNIQLHKPIHLRQSNLSSCFIVTNLIQSNRAAQVRERRRNFLSKELKRLNRWSNNNVQIGGN